MTDFETLLKRGAESKELDYKSPMAWDTAGDNKKACCELAKDVLAMANTLGGYIVIGVAEESPGFKLKGLSKEQIDSYESTRLNQFIHNYVDPPINCKVHKPAVDGMNFVVIEVPLFKETPHLCIKEYQDVLHKQYFYMRTDKNESAPIISSSDMRQLIEQAIRTRQDYLLASFRAILSGNNNTSPAEEALEAYEAEVYEAKKKAAEKYLFFGHGFKGFREAWFFPVTRKPERLSLQQLQAFAKRATISHDGWPFLFFSSSKEETYNIQDGIETAYFWKDFGSNDRFDFWRFHKNALFYQRVLMFEDSLSQREKTDPFIDLFNSTIYVALALECMVRLYDSILSPEDEVTIIIAMTGIEGRRVIELSRQIPLIQKYTCMVPNLKVKATHSYADWKAGLVDHAVNMTAEMQIMLNLDSPLTNWIQNIIKDLFKKQY